MDACLSKPVEEAELLRVLAQWTPAQASQPDHIAPPPTLQARFVQRLVDDRVALAASDDRDSVSALAHRLGGSAGAFGFPEVGARACALEDAISDGAPHWREKRADLLRAIDVAARDAESR
jgi:hypothetical protein